MQDEADDDNRAHLRRTGRAAAQLEVRAAEQRDVSGPQCAGVYGLRERLAGCRGASIHYGHLRGHRRRCQSLVARAHRRRSRSGPRLHLHLTSTQLCCRGLIVGAQRPPLSGMHEVGPPRERSTYWVSTATVETATHILSINSADRIPWALAGRRSGQYVKLRPIVHPLSLIHI